jgi:hypothetical protein
MLSYLFKAAASSIYSTTKDSLQRVKTDIDILYGNGKEKISNFLNRNNQQQLRNQYAKVADPIKKRHMLESNLKATTFIADTEAELLSLNDFKFEIQECKQKCQDELKKIDQSRFLSFHRQRILNLSSEIVMLDKLLTAKNFTQLQLIATYYLSLNDKKYDAVKLLEEIATKEMPSTHLKLF